MPWVQRIALTLLAFGIAGLGMIAWQPSGLATTPEDDAAYDLAISSGTSLLLSEEALQAPEKAVQLSCDKVFSIGGISIGAHCKSRSGRSPHATDPAQNNQKSQNNNAA